MITDLDLNWVQFKWRNHQPEIGRFFNVDPLAEDYYYNSPYAFSENRVIDGVELEGLEWKSIKTLKPDGSSHVTLQANIKVKNSSSIPQSAAYIYSFGIADQIESSFQGTDKETNTSYSTEVNLDFDSEIDVTNDFFIELVDNVEGAPVLGTVGMEDGDSQSNRLQVKVDKRDMGEITRTGAHEAGHSVGLKHPKSGSDVTKNGIKLEKDNLMRQSGQTSGTKINTDQLKRASEVIEEDNKKSGNN